MTEANTWIQGVDGEMVPVPDEAAAAEDEAMADDVLGTEVPEFLRRDLPPLDYRSKTIACDVRDSVLGIFERIPKPWSALSESEQLRLSRLIDGTVNLAIGAMAEHIIDEGAPALVARLDRMLVKDKGTIECKVIFPNDQECRDVLGAAVGTDIRVTAINPAALAGLYRKPQTMPDEPELPMQKTVGPIWDEEAKQWKEREEEVDTSDIPDDPDDSDDQEDEDGPADPNEVEAPPEPLTTSKRRRKVA